MTDFWRALTTEYIKLRKTFVVWVILAAPLFSATLFFLISLQVDELPSEYATGWAWLTPNLLSFWSVMILPMLIALVVGLVNYYEHASNSWKHLFALPVSRSAVVVAKLIGCHLIILASTLLALLMTLSVGWLLRLLRPGFGFEAAAPVVDLLGRLMAQYFAVGLVVTILFFVAVRFANIAVTIGVGMIGTFIGMVNVTGWFRMIFPWKLASNTQAVVEHLPEIALALGGGGGVLLAIVVTIVLARREVIS